MTSDVYGNFMLMTADMEGNTH